MKNRSGNVDTLHSKRPYGPYKHWTKRQVKKRSWASLVNMRYSTKVYLLPFFSLSILYFCVGYCFFFAELKSFTLFCLLAMLPRKHKCTKQCLCCVSLVLLNVFLPPPFFLSRRMRATKRSYVCLLVSFMSKGIFAMEKKLEDTKILRLETEQCNYNCVLACVLLVSLYASWSERDGTE